MLVMMSLDSVQNQGLITIVLHRVNNRVDTNVDGSIPSINMFSP